MELEGDFVSERGVLLASGGNDSGAAEGVVTSKSEESGLEKSCLGVDPDGTLGHSDDSGILPARGGKKKRNRKRNKKGRRAEATEELSPTLETSQVQSEATVPGSRIQSADELLEPTTPTVSPVSETPSPSEVSLAQPPKHLDSHEDYVKQDDGYVLNYDKHAKEVKEQLKVIEKGQAVCKDRSIGRSIPCAPNPSVAEMGPESHQETEIYRSAQIQPEPQYESSMSIESPLSGRSVSDSVVEHDDTVPEVPIDEFLEAQDFLANQPRLPKFVNEFDIRSSTSEIPIEAYLTAENFVESETPTNSGTELPMNFKLATVFKIPSDDSGVSAESQDHIGELLETPKSEVSVDGMLDAEMDYIAKLDAEFPSEEWLPLTESGLIHELIEHYDVDKETALLNNDDDGESLDSESPGEIEMPLGDDLDADIPSETNLEQESQTLRLISKEALDQWKEKNPEGVKILNEIIETIITNAMTHVPWISGQQKSEDSESTEILKEFQERASSAIKEETESLNNFLPVKNEDYNKVYPQQNENTSASDQAELDSRKSVHDSEGFPVFQQEESEEGSSIAVSEEEEECRGIFEVIPNPVQEKEDISSKATFLYGNWLPEKVASLQQWYAQSCVEEDPQKPSGFSFAEYEMTPERVASFNEWYKKNSEEGELDGKISKKEAKKIYLDREGEPWRKPEEKAYEMQEVSYTLDDPLLQSELSGNDEDQEPEAADPRAEYELPGSDEEKEFVVAEQLLDPELSSSNKDQEVAAAESMPDSELPGKNENQELVAAEPMPEPELPGKDEDQEPEAADPLQDPELPGNNENQEFVAAEPMPEPELPGKDEDQEPEAADPLQEPELPGNNENQEFVAAEPMPEPELPGKDEDQEPEAADPLQEPELPGNNENQEFVAAEPTPDSELPGEDENQEFVAADLLPDPELSCNDEDQKSEAAEPIAPIEETESLSLSLPEVPSEEILKDPYLMTADEFHLASSPYPVGEGDLEDIPLEESVSDPHFDVRSSSEDIAAMYWATASQDSSLTVVDSSSFVPDRSQPSVLETMLDSVSRTYIPEQRTQFDIYGPVTMIEESQAKRASLGRRVLRQFQDRVLPIVLPCRKANIEPEENILPIPILVPRASISNPNMAGTSDGDTTDADASRPEERIPKREKRFGSLRRMVHRNK